MPSRLSRREWLALSALPAAGFLGWAVRSLALGSASALAEHSELDLSAIPPADLPEFTRLRRLADSIEPLYAKLPPSKPDEWLAKHTELGQTFAQFLGGRPTRLVDHYRRILVVPLGELSREQRELCANTTDYLERFFGFSVEVHDPVQLEDLPFGAQRVRESGERQVLTRHLMQHVLLPLRDVDTAAVVGITASDLWDGEFNFLFGQGAAADRVCICSIARFGDAKSDGRATLLRRTIGLATHETGHVFPLPHCIAFSCRMNGSNHLAESDARPLEFCPECLPKIWWTSPVDPRERFEKLAEFASRHGLKGEAAFWQAARERLAAPQ